MTDRTDPQPLSPPVHAHPMRDWVSLELMLPTHSPFLDRMMDRLEKEAKS